MTVHDMEFGTRVDRAARLRTGALATFAICGPLFLFIPGLDTATSSLFFRPGSGFIGATAAVEWVRNIFKLLYISACVTACLGVLVARVRGGRLLGMTGLQHLFLILCLSMGPGLVTNVAFKDHWGRARPREVTEFGGDKVFTSALMPAQQCKKNCSFVSGEASSIFMIFFAAALVVPRWCSALTALGIAGGLAAGAIRIAQGGHFLSDVIFAGIMMAITATLLHDLFASLELNGSEAQEREP